MTLPTGESPISFSQIRTEFGDGTNTSTSPVRLGQYRRDDSSFTNKTVGIVGMGEIGKAFSKRVKSLSMKIVYFGPNKNLED